MPAWPRPLTVNPLCHLRPPAGSLGSCALNMAMGPTGVWCRLLAQSLPVAATPAPQTH